MNRCPDRQHGWLGSLGLLLALLIVLWLARDALKQLTAVPPASPPAAPEKPAEAAAPSGYQRSPTPAAISDAPPGGTPSFQAPMERARGVDGTVLRGAESQSRRIDDATR